MLARSAKALFSGLIDYAGLFPPAALPMADAVRNYDAYRKGEHAWMLGRFVVPIAKIGEVPDDFPITFVAPLVEVSDHVYIESDDIDTLAVRGLRAKIRTGGVTNDAFPDASTVARFIQRCAEKGVPFKATAGLHHPIRCIKPLTYEPDAPTGTMHGFVNVFMAAALPQHAATILTETDARAFEFGDDAASWRGRSIGTEDLARIRSDFAISFGSCSFEEPVADLKELGWL
ncbi:MAG TPA: hypothetical protein VJ901_00575 [Thermoanaerobaculia bacterium]|nr:hypothetical protein [Thermoanaerobaculia bacterium]